jgi:hypothetical protein
MTANPRKKRLCQRSRSWRNHGCHRPQWRADVCMTRKRCPGRLGAGKRCKYEVSSGRSCFLWRENDLTFLSRRWDSIIVCIDFYIYLYQKRASDTTVCFLCIQEQLFLNIKRYFPVLLNQILSFVCGRTFWVFVCVYVYIKYLCRDFLFFLVLGFELRAYTLSHSTSPFLWWAFWCRVSQTICLGLISNCDPPDLCLLSS